MQAGGSEKIPTHQQIIIFYLLSMHSRLCWPAVPSWRHRSIHRSR
jgi:hypothetical protein